MINYLASFANTNGLTFPDTLSVNTSGGGATDGTEVVKLLIDDMWGARQAIMDHAGLTPDTVTEAPGTAQILDALRLGMLGKPAGSLVGWLQNDDPATFGARALLLTGQGILRANYQELDNAVYVGDPSNPAAPAFYHADDAAGSVRNTAGIYLILPDARAIFWRGTGTHGTLQMADGNFYAGPADIGGSENDQMFGHFHETFSTFLDRLAGVGGGNFADFQSGTSFLNSVNDSSGLPFAKNPRSDTVNGVPRTGDEIRPVNLGIRWAISY